MDEDKEMKIGDWVVRVSGKTAQEALMRLAESRPDEFMQHIIDVLNEEKAE